MDENQELVSKIKEFERMFEEIDSQLKTALSEVSLNILYDSVGGMQNFKDNISDFEYMANKLLNDEYFK